MIRGDILSEFYAGNIRPAERKIVKDSEVGKLNCRLLEEINQLDDLLDQAGKEAFERVRETQLELADATEEECYMNGMRMGFHLALALL